VDEERTARLVWMGLGGVAAILAGAGLVALRDTISSADVVLVLVTVVVVAAAGGGREAGAVTAVTAALSFDFFHTQPYNQLRINSRDDIVTTVLLLVVGLIVGQVAAKGRRARNSAAARSGQIRRIYRVAELAAGGDDPTDVIMGAQAELAALLDLRSCRFEAAPYGPPLERLERSGGTAWHQYRYRDGGFELSPDGVELPVVGRGNTLGRFVLEPNPGTGVSLEQRVVAVAIADQVGAVLAAPQPGEKGHERHG
jgi:hypothetical protein